MKITQAQQKTIKQFADKNRVNVKVNELVTMEESGLPFDQQIVNFFGRGIDASMEKRTFVRDNNRVVWFTEDGFDTLEEALADIKKYELSG